jgi:hypothetical protein
MDSKIKAVVDTGYVGIAKFHVNSVVPIKRSKKKPLSKADKEFNHRVSSERVLNEHVIGLIKRFKMWLIVIIIDANALGCDSTLLPEFITTNKKHKLCKKSIV